MAKRGEDERGIRPAIFATRTEAQGFVHFHFRKLPGGEGRVKDKKPPRNTYKPGYRRIPGVGWIVINTAPGTFRAKDDCLDHKGRFTTFLCDPAMLDRFR